MGMEELVVLPEYENNLIFLGESSFTGEGEEKANLDPKVSGKSRSATDSAKDWSVAYSCEFHNAGANLCYALCCQYSRVALRAE